MKENEKKTIIWSVKEPPKNYIWGTLNDEFLEFKNGKGNDSECIKSSKFITVDSITLNKKKASVSPGSTISLTASVLPVNSTDRTITGISSNTNIATVSPKGRVSVKKSANIDDTVIITAAIGGKSANCSITVS